MLGFCCCGGGGGTSDCGCCSPGSVVSQLLVTVPTAWLPNPGRFCEGHVPACQVAGGTFLLDRYTHPNNPDVCFWKYEYTYNVDQCTRTVCCAQYIQVEAICEFGLGSELKAQLFYQGPGSTFQLWSKLYDIDELINCSPSKLQLTPSGSSGGCVTLDPLEISGVV